MSLEIVAFFRHPLVLGLGLKLKQHIHTGCICNLSVLTDHKIFNLNALISSIISTHKMFFEIIINLGISNQIANAWGQHGLISSSKMECLLGHPV